MRSNKLNFTASKCALPMDDWAAKQYDVAAIEYDTLDSEEVLAVKCNNRYQPGNDGHNVAYCRDGVLIQPNMTCVGK